ncbi:hypothetical protein LCGC14_1744420, partial [marine sediment metagenome]
YINMYMHGPLRVLITVKFNKLKYESG